MKGTPKPLEAHSLTGRAIIPLRPTLSSPWDTLRDLAGPWLWPPCGLLDETTDRRKCPHLGSCRNMTEWHQKKITDSNYLIKFKLPRHGRPQGQAPALKGRKPSLGPGTRLSHWGRAIPMLLGPETQAHQEPHSEAGRGIPGSALGDQPDTRPGGER